MTYQLDEAKPIFVTATAGAEPPRILLVEDDPVMQQLMSTVLEVLGYSVQLAGDGQEALDILEASAINLVVSDWLMPRMDGPELCRRVRARITGKYVYIILLTARHDETSLVEGMEAGADDFLTKPPNLAELRVRLLAGQRVLALELELASQNDRLKDANRQLQESHAQLRRDLEAAALAQRRLLPPPADLPGMRYGWLFFPSSDVAGDTFGIVRQSGTSFAFFQIDVSGHGVPAALLSFTLQRLLSGGLQVGVRSSGADVLAWDPAAIIAELNQRFQDDDDGMYFTIIFGVIDEVTGGVVLSQGGHPSPLHIRRADTSVTAIGDGGPLVGLFPSVEYENVTFSMQPGDRLILYSDGISECTNRTGEMFGDERLLTLATDIDCLDLPRAIQHVGQQLQAWRGGVAFDDDVSLLLIEKK